MLSALATSCSTLTLPLKQLRKTIDTGSINVNENYATSVTNGTAISASANTRVSFLQNNFHGLGHLVVAPSVPSLSQSPPFLET